VIFVLDGNESIRNLIREILEDADYSVLLFADCETFLASYVPERDGCILADAVMPNMGGIELLEHLHRDDQQIPVVVMTGSASVPQVVRAMKAGAQDVIEKPFRQCDLLSSVDAAIEQAHLIAARSKGHLSAARRIAGLTSRQHQILDLVVAGHPSKNIAADLGISQRTVENHRAAITRRTGSSSLPELVRTALAAL